MEKRRDKMFSSFGNLEKCPIESIIVFNVLLNFAKTAASSFVSGLPSSLRSLTAESSASDNGRLVKLLFSRLIYREYSSFWSEYEFYFIE